MLTDCVCRECNGAIGQAEEQLGRSGPEALLRALYGIDGRTSHKRVNPFMRGSGGAPAIDLVAPSPESGIPILWEINRRGGTVREVSQVVVVDDHGVAHQIRISKHITESSQLREHIEKLDVKVASIQAFAENAELPRIEALVKGLGFGIKWESPPEGAAINNPAVNFQVTNGYFRAIAKVGFHYLLATTREVDGTEPEFAPIRDFIRWGVGTTDDFVDQRVGSLVARPTEEHRPERPAHLLVAEWSAGQVEARMQFFFGPECQPTIYRVRLGRGLSGLAGRGTIGHCYGYFEPERRGRYAGDVSQLLVQHGPSPRNAA